MDCPFGERRTQHCAAGARGSFFRILNRLQLRVGQSFRPVLSFERYVLLIYPGGMMMPIICF
jgi:hypothetical protein